MRIFQDITGLDNTSIALRDATSVAAELLQQDDIGVLAPGRRADSIAMPDSPFDDITATERVDFVMQGGMYHQEKRHLRAWVFLMRRKNNRNHPDFFRKTPGLQAKKI